MGGGIGGARGEVFGAGCPGVRKARGGQMQNFKSKSKDKYANEAERKKQPREEILVGDYG